MESSYGIGTKNRYALFYDDEQDPVDVIKAREAEREKKKQKQVQDKENKGKVTNSLPKPKQAVVAKKVTKDVPPPKQEIPPKKEAPAPETNNKLRSQHVPNEQQKNVKFNSVPGRDRGDREPREPRLDKNDSRGPQSTMEERKNRRNREEGGSNNSGFPSNDFKDPARSDRRLRGRGGGFGAPRGGPRGERGGLGRGSFDNRGKREFDRHSGSEKSGVKPSDKREGSGAHNWGNNIRDEVDEQMNTTNPAEESRDWTENADDQDTENTKNDGTAPATTEDASTEEPKPEEPKEMTLDEWKKEQEKNRFVPQFNLRKAGEGEDNSQWKKTYVLQKKKGDDTEGENEEGEEEDDDHVARGRKKQVVDIEINFVDSRRGRGRGRGGRGGPGGDRGGPGGRGGRTGDNPERGGGRGSRMGPSARTPNKQQVAPRVDDEKDFPALG